MEKLNCRNLALELAREVQKSVVEAESALESSGNQEHTARESSTRLKVQAAKLNEISREQRSDLYYQSPWTAGCHMVEILDMAFDEGVNLCCGFGYVCAVLHLYKALRHLDPPTHQITLLEQLSQLFLRELLLGTIPAEDFGAHFCKASERGLAKEITSQMGGRRGLSVATTTSKPAADRMSFSLFHELTSYDYQPTNELLAKVYIEPSLREPTRSQLADVSREVHSVLFSVPLDKIKTAVGKEFTGDLPTMRTNLFAIFHFCTEVLRSVSEVGRDDTSSPKPPNASSGREIVNEVLDIIVNHLGDDT